MENAPPVVTRFAPSPNGHLHLGHAYSAIIAHDFAKQTGGDFILRIEDIDGPRSNPALSDEFRRDLDWLGLEWTEVPAQSTRLEVYAKVAAELQEDGLVYPCSCTRGDVALLPPRLTEDGREYPGSCKGLCSNDGGPMALRLDIDRAMEKAGEVIWTDELAGSVIADPRDFGDVVLVRKDLPASYHLAVTLDDANDGITVVTRGRDLFACTSIHRILQELLRLPVPHWLHHDLILDETDKKLSKRRGSPALMERRLGGEDGLKIADELRLLRFGVGT